MPGELCAKGYARQNEYLAHESSYDHQHKKRLKDLKAMSKTMEPTATTKARKAEQKGLEKSGASLIKINPIAMPSADTASAGGAGFKKGGFRSAFGRAEDVEAEVMTKNVVPGKAGLELQDRGDDKMQLDESDTGDEGYEMYNPRRPTGCTALCRAKT